MYHRDPSLPLLLIIYINDHPLNIRLFKTLIYAEDASLFLRQQLSSTAEEVSGDATEWFQANKFGIECREIPLPAWAVEFRFLGVCFDDKEQIQNMWSYLARSIYAIHRIDRVAGKKAAPQAYFRVVHSKATYSILLWGGKQQQKR